MPCSDVTEVLLITLDHHDRLLDYRLNKRTCGGEVGQNPVVKEWLKNYAVPQIITISVEEFLSYHPTNDVLQEFFYLKHFLAVQGALQVLFGINPGGEKSPCVIREILYEDDAIKLFCELKVDILTEKIQACGRCVGCGTKREVKVPAAGLPIVTT